MSPQDDLCAGRPGGVACAGSVPRMVMEQAIPRTGERPGASPAVSTAGLTKRFGDRTVVDDVGLAIPSGSVCGFVGPNGAGKTTTIRMLLGLVRPTSGSGRILGGSLAEPATYLHKVGALIESPAFYPQLSGRENLKALARLGRLPLTAVDPALERSGLLARAGDRYRSYSLGMKQRLGIAAAMLAGPELLILDEPTNGLDPAGIVEMRGLIKSLAGEGRTVLVSSHLISEIEQICDYVVMIRAGRLVHQGSVAELRATQQAEFLVAPEHDADRGPLARLLQQAGGTVAPDTAEGALVVQAPGTGAADLNRLAAQNGITLRQLAERTRSLERAFFALTGTKSADVTDGQEMGAIG
ncbi:MAG: ABC transporter ATP-binding protein [Actinomycetota bacterium]|nr:ABC transporter ATP-binding protein [Actinomycetota bacterium]